MPPRHGPRSYMTTRKFDRCVLGLIVAAVAMTAAASITSPAKGVTAQPRVSFAIEDAEVARLVPDVRPEAPRLSDPASGNMETAALVEEFKSMGYRLEHVRRGETDVPRVFLAKLPDDLPSVHEVELRKTAFFKTILPLVLNENERIAKDRQRLQRLKARQALGYDMPAADRLWLAVLAERYRMKNDDLGELLRRVDVIPVSLAIAQAAEESGWGTSRFAQTGNALFGQWTVASDIGIVPEDREEGMTHKIKAFDNLAQSVAAYMRNLNTHRAYREFRAKRVTQRTWGDPLDGRALAGTLLRYSERGEKYVRSLRTIMDANDLPDLDRARLANKRDADRAA